MQTAKDKIKIAVTEYKKLFPLEYKQFQVAITAKREDLVDKWASIEGDHVFERALYEVPEKLHNAIQKLLSDEELSWFNERDKDKKGATKWFLEVYPEFKITKEY